MSKKVNQSLETKSIKYFSDRGNDTYLPNQEIKIKIDPASCPILNPLETYLKFSFKVPRSCGGTLVPDSALFGNAVWETLTILDGTESTILEQINNIDVLQTVKNNYGKNKNDDNLDRVFHGKVSHDPPLVADGGGINSVYYNRPVAVETEGVDINKKVELLYHFNCSGLLGKNDQILPLVALNGLVIRLKLRDARKVLRELIINGRGKGLLNANGTQVLTERVYTLTHYIDNGGAEQNINGLTNGVDFQGFLFDRGNQGIGTGLTDVRDFPCTKGCRIAFVNSTDGDLTGFGRQFTSGVVSSISNNGGAGNNQIKVLFPLSTFNANGGNNIPANAKACVAIANNPTYEINDVELIASCVMADAGYMKGLENKINGKGLNYQFYTYQDYPININQNTVNELYIPATQKRAFSVINVPESIGQDSPNNPNYQPNLTGLKDYQYVIGSTNIPSLPVSLSRIPNGLVDPLHLIELQKGLDQTSIKVKNLLNFEDLFIIARSLGRYNNSFNLNVNSLRLKLAYSVQPPVAQIIHNFIYHIRTINISKNGKVVMM